LSEGASHSQNSSRLAREHSDFRSDSSPSCEFRPPLNLSEFSLPPPSATAETIVNYIAQPVGPDRLLKASLSESVTAAEAGLHFGSLFVGVLLVGEWILKNINSRVQAICNGNNTRLDLDENIERMIDCRKDSLEYPPYIVSVSGERIVGYLSYEFRKGVCEVREIAAKNRSEQIMSDLISELQNQMEAARCEEVISIVISEREIEYGEVLTSLGFDIAFCSKGRSVDGIWQGSKYWFEFQFSDRLKKLHDVLSTADIYKFIPVAHIRDVLRLENEVSTLPWSEAELLEWRRTPNCYGMVVTLDGTPVAFCIYQIEKGFLRIVKLTVDPCLASQHVIQDRILSFVSRDSSSGNVRQVGVHLSDDIQLCVDDKLTWFQQYAIRQGLSIQVRREGGPKSPQIVILRPRPCVD
jgi:hypothetical protein